MQEELAYYKSQYETLEAELQEFQNSSKELEAELERDVEESEKRERKLQEKAERLGFEVEEWKVCGILDSVKRLAQSHKGILLTVTADEIQAEQDRGEQRAKHVAEGNYCTSRRTTHATNEVARHRGAERRLRTPGAPPDILSGRRGVKVQRID
jgi:hypothetical protein